jgi:osmotically-inducible protein OsmY
VPWLQLGQIIKFDRRAALRGRLNFNLSQWLFMTQEFRHETIASIGCVCHRHFFVTLVGCASTAKQEGTGEYFDDTVITTKVKAAIFSEPELKSTEINVETFKGVVQLGGFVSSQASIDKAVQVARSVKGVTSVKNDMRLK